MNRAMMVAAGIISMFVLVPAVYAEPQVAKSDKQKTVLVFDLVPENGVSQSTANLLTEVVIDNASKEKKYKVIGQKDISKMMSWEQNKQMAGCSESSCMVQVAGAMGADYYIEGSVGVVGDRYIITIKFIDTASVAVIDRGTKMVAKDENVMVDAVVQLVAEVLKLPMVATASGVKVGGGYARLTVDPTPADASVIVSGPREYMVGGKGRWEKSDLAPGEYKIQASAEGFGPDEKTVKLEGDQVALEQIELKKAGTIDLTGAPDGARVEITGPNGYRSEKNIPYTVKGLRYGNYKIKVSSDGFKPLEREIEVKAGEVSKTDMKLQGLKEAGDSMLDANGLEWVLVPAGGFYMGCSDGDRRCIAPEMPRHPVKVGGFKILKSEVTQGQYQALTGSNPSASQKCGADCPVESVSWDEAQAFCGKAGGRLPTEAEWEFAARAGVSKAAYDKVESIAWFKDNSGGSAHPVKKMAPNKLGLFDMLGNVWEWTSDWFDENYYSTLPADKPADNPKGPGKGDKRSIRGGAYSNEYKYMRASFRHRRDPAGRFDDTGFRCVKD
jgi:formylglycine-generating enzyme required for sulfatase activity/TolB-like protein